MQNHPTRALVSGEMLREWRLQARQTLYQAARVANVKSRKTVMNWEKNVSNPSHNQVISLLIHYGVMDKFIANLNQTQGRGHLSNERH